jgi:hypothetical protein
MHGGNGVGKTTCATGAFKPVVLGTEDGLGLLTVPVFPQPKTIMDVEQAILELISEEHDYRTLVIDTIDGVEGLIDTEVCAKGGKEFMSDFAYYRGNVESASRIEKLLHLLDDLRAARSMQIILISHSVRNTVEDPVIGAYDRMEPNLYRKAVPLLTAWADNVGFLDLERVITDKGDKDSKTVRTSRTSGSRFLNFEDTGSFVAKNRRGLPPQIEITVGQGWSAVEKAMKTAEKKGNRKK